MKATNMRARRLTASDLDRREIPAYGIIEVADYLRIPRKTVEYWVSGGRSPLVRVPSTSPPRFSFMNLLECHILSAMRWKGVRVEKVRRALEYIERQWPSRHPLLDQLFQTDGIDLFVAKLPDEIINVSKQGQLGFKNILETFLERIELDASRIAAKFFPFVEEKKPGGPKIIEINPSVAFGRPVIAGTGITADIIAGRFAARESVAALAEEYGRPPGEIEEAIRWASKTS
jgi:uncharacterized protein (DUF433 family)